MARPSRGFGLIGGLVGLPAEAAGVDLLVVSTTAPTLLFELFENVLPSNRTVRGVAYTGQHPPEPAAAEATGFNTFCKHDLAEDRVGKHNLV